MMFSLPKKFILCFVSAVLLFSSFSQGDEAVVAASEKVVGCYFASWSVYLSGDEKYDVEDIDTTLCTHIFYAFAILNGDTYEIEAGDPYNDIDMGAYKRFTDLAANNPNLKAVLSIGGWGEDPVKYSEMAKDPETRANFVRTATGYVLLHNFDGLDLDWEYPGHRGGLPEDKDNFSLLVAELRAEFDKHNLLVTAAIGLQTNVLTTAYDFPAICEGLDFINLMSYDLQGPWDNVTGHHASLYQHPNLGELANSLTNSLEVINSLGGCPSKMVLGMAMYGKTYLLTDPSLTDIGSPTSGTGMNSGAVPFHTICHLEGYTRDIDNYTMAPWAFKDYDWFSYDDVASIQVKSNWALENGLLGGMIWALDLDDFHGSCNQGTYPLLTQIRNVMSAAP